MDRGSVMPEDCQTDLREYPALSICPRSSSNSTSAPRTVNEAKAGSNAYSDHVHKNFRIRHGKPRIESRPFPERDAGPGCEITSTTLR